MTIAVAAPAIDLNRFDPSPARAQAVAARMRRRLADSLSYIRDEVGGEITIPRGFDAFLDRLTKAAVSPSVFGAYCDLVLALEAEVFDEAESVLAEIAAAPNVCLGPAIFDLADRATDIAADRYCRLADTDASMRFVIRPPNPEHADVFRGLIDDAMALIERGNPALHGEIRELLAEIVLAGGTPDPNGATFEGISSFLLWGATILNVEMPQTLLDMVQVLAHESGHNLLFGLCAHGPMHENDDEERFASPLREDARPIDGIVHATYVTARMHQSVQRLLDAGILSAAQRDEAVAANVANVKRWLNGIETIDRHARLTPLGREVMDGARDYMAAYL